MELEPFKVEDEVPEEGEIEWAVKRLRNNRSGGTSQLAAARRGDTGETAETEMGGQESTQERAENWTRFVDLVQTGFKDGDLAEEANWQVLVLIPKGKKDYRGIGLVEVMWKVLVAILNRRFAASITYHDLLHGFRAGRRIGTTNVEAKLFQHIAALR